MPSKNLYDSDFYQWSQQQCHFLKSGQWNELDIANLAEEIEDIGKSLKRELEGRLKGLLVHLMKWKYQPELRGNSWLYSIEEQREQIEEHPEENQSLRHPLPGSSERAFRYALTVTAKETGYTKSFFSKYCLWSLEQVINPKFYPET